MCGIAGYVNFGGAPADAFLVQRTIEPIRHRSSGDAGICTHDRVGLGHVRLSIIDLAGGHPPMGSEDGPFVAVFVRKFRSGRPTSVKDNMALVGVLSTELLADAFIRRRGQRRPVQTAAEVSARWIQR